MSPLEFDEGQAISRLMRFLAIEGTTGHEEAIGKDVVDALEEAGIPRRDIHFDDANKRIPLPTETGNLIVTMPGTLSGARRLFMTHLDTVPLCSGAQPKRQGKRIVPAGKTALGGDNRTGVACLVTLATTLLKNKLPHPPLTLLFTVREESGLYGARYVNADELGGATEAFNIDGRAPADLTIGAVGAERWEVEITGRAAHAGVHPEQGVSSTMVASLALAEVHRKRCFGKIKLQGHEGTSNVGSFGGVNGTSAGVATNVVTDYAHLRGEVRSHEAGFVKQVTSVYKEAFEAAGKKVRDHKGKGAKVKFTSHRDYHAFRLKDSAPVVKHAIAAAERAGLTPTLRTTNGGLDANWMVKHGIPTVTFGAGQHEIHTVDEYVEIDEFLEGCKLALALATLEM